jgi:hypothetical protein
MSRREKKHKKCNISSSASSSSSSASSSSSSSSEETVPNDQKVIKAYTSEQLDSVPQLEYEKATFLLSCSFMPKDLYSTKSGNLKNQGKLVFSAKDGSLTRVFCSNATDFKEKEKGGSHATDIVKNITLSDLTTNWPGMLLVQCETVPKYRKEGFYGTGSYVNKVFLPGVLSATQPKTFGLLNRQPKTGTFLFQNKFPNMNPDNFTKDISFTRDHAIIPLNNPVIMYYNSHPTTTDKITTASKGFEEENQVKMKKDVAENMIKFTKENMQSRISYGDITNNFQITLSVPASAKRMEQHKMHESGHKNGIPWENFADALNALPHINLGAKNEQGVTHRDAFLNTPYFFHTLVEVEYLSNDKTIPLKI